MHVIAAHAAFNSHQNGVGNDPLYHTHAAKCMMCTVQEKSKHNLYRSTMRQIKVALKRKFCIIYRNCLVNILYNFLITH